MPSNSAPVQPVAPLESDPLGLGDMKDFEAPGSDPLASPLDNLGAMDLAQNGPLGIPATDPLAAPVGQGVGTANAYAPTQHSSNNTGSSNNVALWITLGVSGGVALLCILGFSVWFMMSGSDSEEAIAQAPPPAVTGEGEPTETPEATTSNLPSESSPTEPDRNPSSREQQRPPRRQTPQQRPRQQQPPQSQAPAADPSTFEGLMQQVASNRDRDIFVSFAWNGDKQKTGHAAQGQLQRPLKRAPNQYSWKYETSSGSFGRDKVKEFPLELDRGFPLTELDFAQNGIPWNVEKGISEGLFEKRSKTYTFDFSRLSAFGARYASEFYYYRVDSNANKYHRESRLLWSADSRKLFVMDFNPKGDLTRQGPRRLLKIDKETWTIEQRCVPGNFHLDDIGWCSEGLLCLLSNGAASSLNRIRGEKLNAPWFPVHQGAVFGSILAVVDPETLDVKKAWSLPMTHRIAGARGSNIVRTLYRSRYSAAINVENGEIIDLDDLGLDETGLTTLSYSDDGKYLWRELPRSFMRFTNDGSIMRDPLEIKKNKLFGFTPDKSMIVGREGKLPKVFDPQSAEEVKALDSTGLLMAADIAVLATKHLLLRFPSSEDNARRPFDPQTNIHELRAAFGGLHYPIEFKDLSRRSTMPVQPEGVIGQVVPGKNRAILSVPPDESGTLIVTPYFVLWVDCLQKEREWGSIVEWAKEEGKVADVFIYESAEIVENLKYVPQKKK
ncbi:MAG: hypothetical protein AAF394_05730 [Planctomycetota bacterium]